MDEKIIENQGETYNLEELHMKLKDLEKKLEECIEVFITQINKTINKNLERRF